MREKCLPDDIPGLRHTRRSPIGSAPGRDGSRAWFVSSVLAHGGSLGVGGGGYTLCLVPELFWGW